MPEILRKGECIFRYEVPVDGQWHDLAVVGDVLHVDGRQFGVVGFWARSGKGGTSPVRRFLVVGTGHEVPEHCTYLGSVLQGGLVWHLVEAAT